MASFQKHFQCTKPPKHGRDTNLHMLATSWKISEVQAIFRPVFHFENTQIVPEMDESCILYYFSRVTWLVDWWLDQRVFRVMMNRMNRKKESCESWWIAWIEKESLASHHESYESKKRVLRVIMNRMTRRSKSTKSCFFVKVWVTFDHIFS